MLLKKWAMIAKKSKDFYDSDESTFFHSLYYKSLTLQLSKEDIDAESVKVTLVFLDFINFYLSSTRDKQRQFILYAVQDQQTLIRTKFSPLMSDPKFKEPLTKRIDELRHYLNYEIKDKAIESEESKTTE